MCVCVCVCVRVGCEEGEKANINGSRSQSCRSGLVVTSDPNFDAHNKFNNVIDTCSAPF